MVSLMKSKVTGRNIQGIKFESTQAGASYDGQPKMNMC